jgi:hypothetical protein
VIVSGFVTTFYPTYRLGNRGKGQKCNQDAEKKFFLFSMADLLLGWGRRERYFIVANFVSCI